MRYWLNYWKEKLKIVLNDFLGDSIDKIEKSPNLRMDKANEHFLTVNNLIDEGQCDDTSSYFNRRGNEICCTKQTVNNY